MKRMRKRVLGVALGLTLGWVAQGYFAQSQTAAEVQTQQASQAQSAEQVHPHAQSHTATSTDAQASPADAPFAGAEQLMPNDQDMQGHAILAALVLALFAAAIVIGGPALSFADRHHLGPASNLHDDQPHQPIVHHHKGSH